jgi:enoyl-CoA hydratase/carnithine racemase
VPTIGVIQGPAFVHFETALMCDITLCADDAIFKDPHADFGLAPGDGLGLAFQHLMNPKQQAYYLYTSDTIDAQTALRLGMVNEVLPQAELMPRARAIAARILRMPKLARLMSKQIVRRQLQQRHVQDAGFHLAHELLGFMTNVREGTAHTPEQVRASLDDFDNDRAKAKWR